LFFVSVLCVSFEIDEHGSRRGDVAWALALWRHLVALHEATNALHQAMRPASHRHIRLGIGIASISHVIFVVVNLIVGHNHKLKTMLWL
jgi:hypothetical protein